MAGRRSTKKTSNENNALSISIDQPKVQESDAEDQSGTKLEILGTHEDHELAAGLDQGAPREDEAKKPAIGDSIEEKHDDSEDDGKPAVEKRQGTGDDIDVDSDSDQDPEPDQDSDSDKVYTKSQLKGILDRNTKKYAEQILDLQKQLEEAKVQVEKAMQDGLEKGQVSQRKAEIAKRFGFKETLLPDSKEGLDDFEKQMAQFEKGHERIIPARELQHEDESSWITKAR